MSASIEWSTLPSKQPGGVKKRAPLLYFLILVFVLFIGILVFCYAVTRRANPVFLDQQGKPIPTSSTRH